MKNLKKIIAGLFTIYAVCCLTGCLSFWLAMADIGDTNSATPRIDLTRLDHNDYKYFTYNGKSVKAIYAGFTINCIYIEDRINEEKQRAIAMNNQNMTKSPSGASVGAGFKGSSGGKQGQWSNPNPIDTSRMPDYLRFVVHASSAKLNYDSSHHSWLTVLNERYDGANSNTLVKIFNNERSKHPYYTSSRFLGSIVVCELSPTKDGKLYWWEDGKLYYFQKIYVFDFNAQ